jgi:hypothetical protein
MLYLTKIFKNGILILPYLLTRPLPSTSKQYTSFFCGRMSFFLFIFNILQHTVHPFIQSHSYNTNIRCHLHLLITCKLPVVPSLESNLTECRHANNLCHAAPFLHSNLTPRLFFKINNLKGQCHKIFCFIFFHESSFTKPLKILFFLVSVLVY